MLSNYTHLNNTTKVMVSVSIAAAILILIIGLSLDNHWDNIPCEKILNYDIIPKHDELNIRDHEKFHDRYNNCIDPFK